MGHHLVDTKDGKKFRSDKYPDIPLDKLVLSFNDPDARPALRVFAAHTKDRELAEDIMERLDAKRMVVKKITWSETQVYQALVKCPSDTGDYDILEGIWEERPEDGSKIPFAAGNKIHGINGHEILNCELSTEEPNLTIGADDAK